MASVLIDQALQKGPCGANDSFMLRHENNKQVQGCHAKSMPWTNRVISPGYIMWATVLWLFGCLASLDGPLVASSLFSQTCLSHLLLGVAWDVDSLSRGEGGDVNFTFMAHMQSMLKLVPWFVVTAGWVLRSGRGQLRETGGSSPAETPATSRATKPRQHRAKDFSKPRQDVHLVEIKCCEDTRPQNQLNAAKEQHNDLCNILQGASVTLHIILLGGRHHLQHSHSKAFQGTRSWFSKS